MANYALPDGYSYVDVASAQQYEAHEGVEVVARVTLPMSRSAALAAWIRSIWLKDAEVLVHGEGPVLVGAERCLTALGIKEKLLSVGLLHDYANRSKHSVASLLYKVTDPAKVPITSKLALVRFLHTSDETTEVVWTIKVTPKPPVDAATISKMVAGMLERGIALLGAEAAAKL
jgi:hypothetical protein